MLKKKKIEKIDRKRERDKKNRKKKRTKKGWDWPILKPKKLIRGHFRQKAITAVQ